jgi:hypothetical protein
VTIGDQHQMVVEDMVRCNERTQDRGDGGRNHCTFTGCLLQLWKKLGESASNVFVVTDSHDIVD